VSNSPIAAVSRGALSAAIACTVLLGVVAAPGAVAATFGPPTIVTEQDLGEPGVDVAPDGTIYVNGPTGLLSNLPGSPSAVFRSTDGGASFIQTPPSLRALFPGGGDSDITIDPSDGHLAMTDLYLASSTVSTSSDQGQSWLANPLQGVVVQDRQWVAAAGANDVVYHVTHQIPLGLIASKSLDGGLTYPIHSVAATPADQTGCVCPPGNLIAEAGTAPLGLGDRVGVIYATSTGGIKFARSTNGGLTFASTDVSPAGPAETSIAFPVVANAGAGRLVATWVQREGGRDTIHVATSGDWGTTWGGRRTIVSSGTSMYPWVDARGSKVAISLYHTDDAAATSDTEPDTARWFEYYLESADGGATFSALQTVDATPAKTGKICTEGTGCTGNRQLLDFQQVALDPQAQPNLTWTRVVAGDDTQIRFVRGS
jgi:hypothetical protein